MKNKKKVPKNLHQTNFYLLITVWKFQDLSVIHILREINFGESRSAKPAIVTHFEPLIFYFYAFLYLLKAEICQKLKFSASKCVKMTDFTLLESPKLVSRKIRVIEKS